LVETPFATWVPVFKSASACAPLLAMIVVCHFDNDLRDLLAKACAQVLFGRFGVLDGVVQRSYREN
jgi:hypothetical protein